MAPSHRTNLSDRRTQVGEVGRQGCALLKDRTHQFIELVPLLDRSSGAAVALEPSQRRLRRRHRGLSGRCHKVKADRQLVLLNPTGNEATERLRDGG